MQPSQDRNGDNGAMSLDRRAHGGQRLGLYGQPPDGDRAGVAAPAADGLCDLEYVDAGGLLSYAANYPDLYRRAATHIDKIFKGAKPADLPDELIEAS